MPAFPSRRSIASAVALTVLTLGPGVGRAAAQDIPSPQEAQRLLRQRPELAEQLRQRLGASGLTPSQVRARLRAAGYPDDFLDQYMAGADTVAGAPKPTNAVLDAVRLLGVVGADGLDSLRALTDSALRVADSLRTDSLTRRGTGLKVFGLDVFRRVSTEFRPDMSGPVGDDYALGPGDELLLILTGDVELTHELGITREGTLVIPQVGQLAVNGLTLAQLRDLLYTRLGRVYSGVRRGGNATTRFSVSVTRLRTVQVFVTGDVARPGAYLVSGAATVLSALYAAGGPTENGSLRRVVVRRGSTAVDSLDLYDYLLRGDASHDIRLESGDVIFVGVRGTRVKMTGRVTRPAIYELRSGETLRDAIEAAGGFEADAFRSRVQIHRILPPAERGPAGDDRVVLDVTSAELQTGLGPPFPMEQGDSVVVYAIADETRHFVTVRGDVWVEGPVGYQQGLRLSEAIQLAGGPKPDVYLNQILVSRLRPDSTRTQLRSAFADSTGTVTNDLVLQDQDVIQVFSRTAFRPERFVAITGAVREPGRLPFYDGMTLRDAVLQSAGVTEDAYLQHAEIARLPESRGGGVVATTIRVPLDSTYLFERGQNGEYLGPPGLPAPAGGAPEVALKPYDNILILRQPDWELQRTVAVTGQVRFPGRYSLETRTERLGELLARAGGLTAEAYATGIEFYRSLDNQGRIGIDLPRVLDDPKFRDNLILLGGDSIYIPEYNPVVRVAGAVNAPVAVAYVPGRNLEYYIQAAGGYTRDADRSRAYVVQPSGKVESVGRRSLLPDRIPKPLAGADLFVPEKDPGRESNAVAIFGTVAQILASVVTVLVVALR